MLADNSPAALGLNEKMSNNLPRNLYSPVAPVAQKSHVTSDTLGREFDPGKRDFSH